MKVVMIDALVGNDYSYCLCEALHQNGTDVHLVVPQNRKFPGNVNFKVVYLSPSKDPNESKIKKIYYFLFYLVSLARYIKKIDCDIVHYQFFRRKAGILFLKYLKWRGIKVIFTAHNVLPHEHNKFDYYWKSIIYKNTNAIVAHSNFIKNKLTGRFLIEPSKIEVIPHGNFDIYLPPQDITAEGARSKLYLSLDDNVLLFFGFLRPYKGVDILLKAFEKAAEEDLKLKLIIAGSVTESAIGATIESTIEKSKYKDRIIQYLSYIPIEDVANLFTAADLIVLPYRNIDHSGIIHLAYSFGKPVLATNVGDFNEVIISNKSGIILEGKNPNELSTAIGEMFKNKVKLKEMGIYAKQLSETKYSWKDISEKTSYLYDKILTKHSNI